MIDCERDLYDLAARAVLDVYPDAYLSGEHVTTPPYFPACYIEQTDNAELDSAKDSSMEENATAVIVTVNAYSNSQTSAREDCKAIVSIIDGVLRRRNFKRLSARAIDNAADPSVYRYTARFTAVVDKHGNYYWR